MRRFISQLPVIKIDQRHLPVSFEVKSELFELHMSGVQCALIPKFAKRPSTVEVNFLQSPGANKQ
jgi:hypothetical protein